MFLKGDTDKSFFQTIANRYTILTCLIGSEQTKLQQIRRLQIEDEAYFAAMDTGIEDDYIQRIFHRLVTDSNRLYGLFSDKQLVSLAGFSVYAKRYAMLGRLRTDRRYKRKNFSTEMMTYMINEAVQLPGIHWIGANTQENNYPARRVLEKSGLTPYISLHGATASDTSALTTGEEIWQPIHDLQKKKGWINQAYINNHAIFPYECYYSFPATEDLFTEENLQTWEFYENPTSTRFIITKHDQKKYDYLHVAYPWNDITRQAGLWETITYAYRKLCRRTKKPTFIWIDLTKEEAKALPANHAFELPSPWILYGKD
ncbi:hypothetical protein M948_04495 [Virgibacillus sp. CM-4]|nr:hypothetical protein M948_04495 [Virgibacillus sp. CM-4]